MCGLYSIIKKRGEIMKNLFARFFAAAFLAMSGCSQKVDLEAEKAKVQSAIDQYEQAWQTKEMELFSRIMAHDADMVVYGSDAPEHWGGWGPFEEAGEKIVPAFAE